MARCALLGKARGHFADVKLAGNGGAVSGGLLT